MIKKKLLAVLFRLHDFPERSRRLSLSFSLSFGSVTLCWVLMCRLWLHPGVLDFAEAARTAGTASSSRVSPSTSESSEEPAQVSQTTGPKTLTSSSRSLGKLLSDGSPVMNGSLLLSHIEWFSSPVHVNLLGVDSFSAESLEQLRNYSFFLSHQERKKSHWIWVLCHLTNSFCGLLRGWMHKTNPKLWGTFQFCLDSPGRESHDQTSTASATSCRTLPSANEHKKKSSDMWPPCFVNDYQPGF